MQAATISSSERSPPKEPTALSNEIKRMEVVEARVLKNTSSPKEKPPRKGRQKISPCDPAHGL
jgi:hypothetical protein